MQNFTVEDRQPQKRITGDFQVTPVTGHTPDEAEQTYLARLEGALNTLLADATKDAAEAGLSAAVVAARKQAREAAVASLRSNAEADLTAQLATQKIDEIQSKYQTDAAGAEDGPPKFEAEQDNSRFPGYFAIRRTPFEDSLPDDEEYLKQVWELLNYLAREAEKDQDSLEQGSPKSVGHIEARQRAAERLRWDVNFVGMRTLTAQAATGSLKGIREGYDKSIESVDRLKLEIDDRPDARFSGDFKINVSVNSNQEDLSREHHVYVAQIKDILRQLAMDEVSDDARKYTETIGATRKKLRKDIADKLRSNAEAVSRGRVQAADAANTASTAKGMYLRDLELASSTLFTVTTEQDGQLAVGLVVKVAPDLLPPNNVVSPEKQELYTAILSAQTVIKTVCTRIQNGDDDTMCGQLFTAKPNASSGDRAGLLRDAYVRKLAGIGELGLQGPNTALAKVALDSLRNEFVAQEGLRIKNSYVCRLGVACGVAAGVLLAVYVLIAISGAGSGFWQLHRTFFLAGTGAAIGTWLSFSIREVELSFDHLGVVEADLLDPAFRVLFVIALTVTACLLFWTGVMNIEIGNLKTSAGEFGKAGTVALLVGLFSGLSERALATSISGRAATFVKSISS